MLCDVMREIRNGYAGEAGHDGSIADGLKLV